MGKVEAAREKLKRIESAARWIKSMGGSTYVDWYVEHATSHVTMGGSPWPSPDELAKLSIATPTSDRLGKRLKLSALGQVLAMTPQENIDQVLGDIAAEMDLTTDQLLGRMLKMLPR